MKIIAAAKKKKYGMHEKTSRRPGGKNKTKENINFMNPAYSLFFLILISVNLFGQDSPSTQFGNVEGTLFVFVDFEAKYGDSIKLSSSETKSILTGLKLKDIRYNGACDYLCGSSGIYLNIKIVGNENYEKGFFILDFGYDCDKTKEACLSFDGEKGSATLIYSYNSETANFMNNIWKKTKAKYKVQLDSLIKTDK